MNKTLENYKVYSKENINNEKYIKNKIRKLKYKNKIYQKRIIKIVLLLVVILILINLIVLIITNKNNLTKKNKIGKNSSSQEIVNYILNINSYEAEIDLEVKSNKNSNKYKIKQRYIDKENNSQEVLEPSNIKGLKISREKNKLIIENTKLGITKVLEDYKEISQNNLDLNNFIENYKNNENSKFREEQDKIILETTTMDQNNYQKYETLYISKNTGDPIKMEIKDTNQNTVINIIYNMININKISI